MCGRGSDVDGPSMGRAVEGPCLAIADRRFDGMEASAGAHFDRSATCLQPTVDQVHLVQQQLAAKRHVKVATATHRIDGSAFAGSSQNDVGAVVHADLAAILERKRCPFAELKDFWGGRGS